MKKRRKIYIRNEIERVLLSDVLPYEVPPSFSNRSFFEIVKRSSIRIDGDKAIWRTGTEPENEVIKLLLGLPPAAGVSISGSNVTVSLDGKKRLRNIPFTFRIAHKESEHRELSIMHPINQVEVMHLYDDYKELITKYCDRSAFSIRRPTKVARIAFFKDRLHDSRLGGDFDVKTIEDHSQEYEHLKTFFAYSEYSNIYKFFESYRYLRAEKKYMRLTRFDISKCFDSIYTHSLAWALLDKGVVKARLKESTYTMGGVFDAVMQRANFGETNGILIGPEFSRIFSELILQRIDSEVELALERGECAYKHKVDYEAFRYVDDFFLFYNDERVLETAMREFRLELKKYKLYLNEDKTVVYVRPFVTDITLAKSKISELINSMPTISESEDLGKHLDGENETDDDGVKIKELRKKSVYVSSSSVITKFRAILKETGTSYAEIANYTLTCLDRKAERLTETFIKLDDRLLSEKRFFSCIERLLDLALFIYASAAKVNTTIKICSLVSRTVHFLRHQKGLSKERVNKVLKRVFDEFTFLMKENQRKPYAEVETLYILLTLKEFGKGYRLPLKKLEEFVGIHTNEPSSDRVGYFPIVVTLGYIEGMARYDVLRNRLIEKAKELLSELPESERRSNTEALFLALDLSACPFVSSAEKTEILGMLGVTNPATIAHVCARPAWFVRWKDFDLTRALDAKRSMEVY